MTRTNTDKQGQNSKRHGEKQAYTLGDYYKLKFGFSLSDIAKIK